MIVQNFKVKVGKISPLRCLLVPFYNHQIGASKSSRKACLYHNGMSFTLFVHVNILFLAWYKGIPQNGD